MTKPTFIKERYSAAIGSFDAVAVLLDGHHVDTGAALKHDDTYAKGKLFVSPEQRAILLDLYRIGESTECFFTQTYAVVVI